MQTSRPRRQPSRWLDADCPRGVLAIYDDPRFADRFMVFYARVIDGPRGPYISYRGMSEAPSSPQGVGMYGEMLAHEARNYRYVNRNRACRWSDLPEAVKTCVRNDLSE